MYREADVQSARLDDENPMKAPQGKSRQSADCEVRSGWMVGSWELVQLVHGSTYWRTTGVGTRQGSYAFLMGRVGARSAQAVATVLESLGCCALIPFR
jgi:hypothetical protein